VRTKKASLVDLMMGTNSAAIEPVVAFDIVCYHILIARCRLHSGPVAARVSSKRQKNWLDHPYAMNVYELSRLHFPDSRGF
jgi:hypothetical protein